MPEPDQSKYRWHMLALLTVIATFVSAIPVSCMPVLFKEIADDLGLSLTQVGFIWGIASMAGIFVSIPGGILSDRFNVKKLLGISCLLVGITGALRGLADNFPLLMFTVFLNGVIRLIVPVSVVKIIGMWFTGKNLATAQGIGAMGMGLGLTLGPLISATVLSPWLGGWQNVMYFYGGISFFIGLLWIMFGRLPARTNVAEDITGRVSVGNALSSLIRNKALWFLGLMLFFRSASLMGVTGYVSLYLKGIGWSPGMADGVLTAFYATSTISVVALSTLSDKVGSRKPVLLIGLIVSVLCIGLMPFAGEGIWALMIFNGIFMDGFMAIYTTMLLETKGVGPAFSGMALGLTFTIAQVGSVISPPVGNRLAEIDPQWAFIFWAAMGAAALVPFAFTKETGRKKQHRVEWKALNSKQY